MVSDCKLNLTCLQLSVNAKAAPECVGFCLFSVLLFLSISALFMKRMRLFGTGWSFSFSGRRLTPLTLYKNRNNLWKECSVDPQFNYPWTSINAWYKDCTLHAPNSTRTEECLLTEVSAIQMVWIRGFHGAHKFCNLLHIFSRTPVKGIMWLQSLVPTYSPHFTTQVQSTIRFNAHHARVAALQLLRMERCGNEHMRAKSDERDQI